MSHGSRYGHEKANVSKHAERVATMAREDGNPLQSITSMGEKGTR